MSSFVRPNVLTVLLEYIHHFILSGNIKQTFGWGLPCLLPHYIALFHLSLDIVAN